MSKHYRFSALLSLLLMGLYPFCSWSQSQTITGQITASDENSGLPGVNVLEKGTTNGTVSDADGKFSIQVQSTESVLVFSFVGYASKEVAVGGQSQIEVVLDPDVATLDEVVVIGYDEVRKSDATGSVSVIGTKSFNKGVVNSPQELIAGKAAGVVVTSNSGAPGNTSTIRIRGGSSLNASNDPLIVIDGVPITNTNLGGAPNILSILNPNDIASVSVLKDASAAAIYGLRASNGVIIITTKRGGSGFKINYSGTATFYTSPRKTEVLDADEFRALINEQYKGQAAVLNLLGDANTDWQKEIYQDVVGQDHNINFSGTTLKTPFRVAVGYNNTDGILKTYNFERTSLSLALDPKFLKDALKISVNAKGMINNNNFAEQGAIGDAIRYDPTQPVFNGNTRWRGYTTWTQAGDINGTAIELATPNPVARLALTDNTSAVKRTISNFKADYELPFLKDLHVILNLGYDYTETEGRNNVPDSTQWSNDVIPAGGRNNPYSSLSRNELIDFYGNYNKELSSINSRIEVTAGYSGASFYNEGSSFTTNAANEDTVRINNFKSRHVLSSFFGRANYTFKEKYILTATLRADASSRISPHHRWGLFPSFALAWKIDKEQFLSGAEVLSELKLRLGYGVTGQQDVFGNDYPYIPTYTRSDIAARYQLGDTFYHTLRPDGYDRNFKWETTATINAGIDFGIYENIISGSIDVYRKVSSDQIADIPIPVGTNFRSRLLTNVAEMENHGIELTLNADVVSRDDFEWTVGVNGAYNQNKINYLNLSRDPKYFVLAGGVGGTTAGEIQVNKVGVSRYAFYPFKQVYDQNGKPVEDVYVDVNNDGLFNGDDRYVYKRPDPLVTLGLNSRLNYHNFDFAFNARASFGNYVYNNVAANSTYLSLYDSKGFLMNVTRFAHDTQFTKANNTRFSDYYIENASFFRMDNINAGYTFRGIYQDRLNMRLGVGVQNAFVITNYSGIDPEVSNGIDNNVFPRTRAFFFNVNLEF